MVSHSNTLKLSSTTSLNPLLSNNKVIAKKIRNSVSVLLIMLFQSSAFADTIPNFTANFNLYAIGMKLGSSNHTLKCLQSDCTLQAVSKPQGLVKLLYNQSSEETIKLHQTDEDLIWKSYLKRHGKDLNDPKMFKTDHFFVSDQQPTEIVNPARQQSWPMQTQVYDDISLAYAVQFNVLNERPLNNFYLQDRKLQEPVVLKGAFINSELKLDNGQTLKKAQLFEFETPRAKVKVWLLPSYHYFPGRVEVYNIEKDKTLTLLLQEPPKI